MLKCRIKQLMMQRILLHSISISYKKTAPYMIPAYYKTYIRWGFLSRPHHKDAWAVCLSTKFYHFKKAYMQTSFTTSTRM